MLYACDLKEIGGFFCINKSCGFFSLFRLCKCLFYSQRALKRYEPIFPFLFLHSLPPTTELLKALNSLEANSALGLGNSPPPVVPLHTKDSSFLWLLSCLCNEARGEASWSRLRDLLHANWPQGHASRDLTIQVQKSKGYHSSAPSAQVTWKFAFHSKFHIMGRVLKSLYPHPLKETLKLFFAIAKISLWLYNYWEAKSMVVSLNVMALKVFKLMLISALQKLLGSKFKIVNSSKKRLSHACITPSKREA